MLFALLWNRNLQNFWRQELGEGFLARLKKIIPYTWLVDPAPLPPHAAIPELNLTDWQQLKTLSQQERDLILKVSGFSENAWGARGVFLGSDLPHGGLGRGGGRGAEEFRNRRRASCNGSTNRRWSRRNWFDFAKERSRADERPRAAVSVLFCQRRRRQLRVRNWAACWRRLFPPTKKSSMA